MYRAAAALLTLTLTGCSAPGQAMSDAPVRYEISYDGLAHHEAEISVTYTELPATPLELRMSRTSPGRYALHEFAKNVYDVTATGADGRALTLTRPNPHQWDVEDHGGTVRVTYTLYADRADGTYTGIDRSHAHMNMPATFMWARGTEARPIELTIRVPEGSGWRVASQLAPTEDPTRFTAPDLAYFLDSPTEVSDHWVRRWDVSGADVGIALHHAGTEGEAEAYADAVQAIVATTHEIYGELPAFDYGAYTFLACYLPWVDGDGMEHRNSTILTSTGTLADNMTGLLGTVAHEFFHAWSVERIRPASLEPFDFEAANMSGELWFAEGFTSYYDDLILWRAGLIDDGAFATRMGGIANAVVNARGRWYFSPIEMSMQAPFVDDATSLDPSNRGNTFLSYYTWGSGVGLALDLTLRQRFPGTTLDHLMREMWATHGATEVPYVVDDIEAALARVTGDAAFAGDFFDRFVRGSEAPDYEGLLGQAGIVISLARPGDAWLGPLAMSFDGGAATMVTTPLEDTPLYEAGLDRGDRITSVGGGAAAQDAIAGLLQRSSPGDMVTFQFESRGETVEATATLVQDPALRGALRAGGPTAEEAAFLASWKAATPG